MVDASATDATAPSAIKPPTIVDYPGLRTDGDEVPGVIIQLGRYRLMMPPGAFGDMKRFLVSTDPDKPSPMQLIQAMMKANVVEAHALEYLFEMLWLALKRNYPAITRDFIERFVDHGNVLDLINALFAANNLRPTDGATAPTPSPATPTPAQTPNGTSSGATPN